MKTGIYLIKNKLNGKCYVGQSIDIEARWKQHIIDSKNKCNQAIHKAISKYGKENFEFSVLEECSADELDEREIHWIKELDTFNSNSGYNCTLGGGGRNEGKDSYSAEYNRVRQKAYRESNPENVRSRHKAWRDANPDNVRAYHKAWRDANPEYMKEYYEKNKEKVSASSKAYYEVHKLKPTPDHTEMPLW